MRPVAMDSAMRQGEVHKLNQKDLDFETPHPSGRDLITLRGRKDKSTDAGKTMVIPMFEPTREVLLGEYEWSVGSNAPVANHVIGDSPELAVFLISRESLLIVIYLQPETHYDSMI